MVKGLNNCFTIILWLISIIKYFLTLWLYIFFVVESYFLYIEGNGWRGLFAYNSDNPLFINKVRTTRVFTSCLQMSV